MALAVFLTYLAVALVCGGILWLLIWYLSRQGDVFRMENLTEFCRACCDKFSRTVMDLQRGMNVNWITLEEMNALYGDLFTQGLEKLQRIQESTGFSLGSVVSLVANSAIAVVLSVYFILEKKRLIRYGKWAVRGLGGEKTYRVVRRGILDLDKIMSGYIRGQLLDVAVMIVLISAVLLLCRVPLALVIGIVAGLGNLIPYLGPVIAYGASLLVLAFTGQPGKLFIVVAALFVIQSIDGNYINPRLMSRSMPIPPLVVVLSLLVGNRLAGFLGMVFAVPVGAFLKVELDRIINRGHAQRRRKRFDQTEDYKANG